MRTNPEEDSEEDSCFMLENDVASRCEWPLEAGIEG
jgi:hypothetical protein